MNVAISQIQNSKFKIKKGGLAQLARAPALQAGGQRFESVILHFGYRLWIQDLKFKIHNSKLSKANYDMM